MNKAIETPKFTVVKKPSKVKAIAKAVIKHTTWKGFCYFCFAMTSLAIMGYYYIESQRPWWERLF